MSDIANISDIQNLIVDVSEEINQKNLLNFTQTSLDINNIKYSSNDIIYCKFLEYSKQYQIFVFSSTFKYMLIELLNYYNDETKDTKSLMSSLVFKLYITKSFFVIYKNDELYVYQVLNHKYKNDELLAFINKSFNITISKSHEISESSLNKIIENKHNQIIISSFYNLNKKSNKSFLLYLLYLVVCVFFILIYKNHESNILKDKRLEKINTHKEEYLKISKMLKFKPFKNEYIKLVNTADKYKLKILSFDYNPKIMKIKFSSKNKENIYSFLNEYKNSVVGNSIVRLASKNIFISTVNVKPN